MAKRSVWFGAAVLALALLVAACGGGDDDSSVSTDTNDGTTTSTTAAPSNDGGSDGGDGNDVLTIQRELVSLNCNPGPLDGELGPDTVRAIRFFQQTVGITVDGVVGPQTRARAHQRRAGRHTVLPEHPTASPALDHAADDQWWLAVAAVVAAAARRRARRRRSSPR